MVQFAGLPVRVWTTSVMASGPGLIPRFRRLPLALATPTKATNGTEGFDCVSAHRPGSKGLWRGFIRLDGMVIGFRLARARGP